MVGGVGGDNAAMGVLFCSIGWWCLFGAAFFSRSLNEQSRKRAILTIFCLKFYEMGFVVLQNNLTTILYLTAVFVTSCFSSGFYEKNTRNWCCVISVMRVFRGTFNKLLKSLSPSRWVFHFSLSSAAHL